MKFTGKVQNGSLKMHDPSGLKRYLNGIKGDVWIDIKVAPKMRSSEQNGYYRTVIRQLGNHLGYNENEMHEVIKLKFEIESTKDLTKDEFSDLLDRVIRFAATLGFAVQDPRRT